MVPARLVPSAPSVIQTDAHEVVCRTAGFRSDRPKPNAAECPLGLAEVHIEIFEFGAPAAAEGSFDAGSRGPSSLHILEGRDRGRAGDGDRRAILDLAIGSAGRAVKQEVRRRQDAQAAA